LFVKISMFNKSWWVQRRLDTASQKEPTRLRPEKRTEEGIEGYVNNQKEYNKFFHKSQENRAVSRGLRQENRQILITLTVSNLFFFLIKLTRSGDPPNPTPKTASAFFLDWRTWFSQNSEWVALAHIIHGNFLPYRKVASLNKTYKHTRSHRVAR